MEFVLTVQKRRGREKEGGAGKWEKKVGEKKIFISVQQVHA